MDKIEVANWPGIFSYTNQVTLHEGDRYSETESSFSEPGLAAGSSRTIATPHMLLTQFSISAERLLQLKDPEGTESAESVFVLHGKVESQFPGMASKLGFCHRNHSMQYNTSFAGSHVIQPGTFSALSITYDLPYLKSLLQASGSPTLYAMLESMERKENFLAFPHTPEWQPQIAEAIHAIYQCKFQGLTRHLFMESKMMELFALQIAHIPSAQAAQKQHWTQADKEKLYEVRQYLQQNYLEELSLKQLTQQFQLNEYKLKKGYRHFFATTVFGQIHSLRMLKAKQLLKEGQMNITEVAYYIGYQNVGSFSAEFQKRFGYSPGKLLRRS